MKLCCPFVLLSSRNIGESSSSTSTLTSIQPNNTQRLPAVINLTSHSPTTRPPSSSLTPRESPSPPPSPRTINACRPARLDRDTILGPSQLGICLICRSYSVTLVYGAPATSAASVYAGVATREPVRALGRPSSRLPPWDDFTLLDIRAQHACILTLESALQARLKTDFHSGPSHEMVSDI